jgi:hypothetical protein
MSVLRVIAVASACALIGLSSAVAAPSGQKDQSKTDPKADPNYDPKYPNGFPQAQDPGQPPPPMTPNYDKLPDKAGQAPLPDYEPVGKRLASHWMTRLLRFHEVRRLPVTHGQGLKNNVEVYEDTSVTRTTDREVVLINPQMHPLAVIIACFGPDGTALSERAVTLRAGQSLGQASEGSRAEVGIGIDQGKWCDFRGNAPFLAYMVTRVDDQTSINVGYPAAISGRPEYRNNSETVTETMEPLERVD